MGFRIMRSRQAGLTTVEVAISGTVFFLAIFTLIETGRLLWAWETLTEATRRGARVAAVCPVNHSAIANVMVLNNPSDSGASAILPGLDTAQVTVEYLDQNGNVIPNPATCASWVLIDYVRTRIAGYNHNFVIPAFGAVLPSPPFETTLPRESLGKVPGVNYQCYGSVSPNPCP